MTIRRRIDVIEAPGSRVVSSTATNAITEPDARNRNFNMTDLQTVDGFGAFVRRYTRTWIHAVTMAALTAFGTLTVVHRGFAAVALGVYVVPPIVLYVRHTRSRSRADDEDVAPSETAHVPDESGEMGTNANPTDRSSERRRSTFSPDEGENGSPVKPSNLQSQISSDRSDGRGSSTAYGTAGTADAEFSLESPTDRRTHPDRTKRGDQRDRTGRTEWHRVDVPTDSSLFDAVVTGANDAYAVGASGVIVSSSSRPDPDEYEGEAWTVVLEDGPAAQSNDLTGVDATTGDGAVWVAGDSGALGRIETDTHRHTDYTAPADITDNWTGIAVAGSSGDEIVLLSNGSGQLLRGAYDAGELEWSDPVKPGSGSSLSGVDLVDPSIGHCCDTSDGVFEITDGGESFDRVGLDASGTLVDVATLERETCLAAADDGVVHRYDGTTWTPTRVADELTGIACAGDRVCACSEDGSISERMTTQAIERSGSATPSPEYERVWTWERTVDTDEPLYGLSVGTARAVAVGGEGTVFERVFDSDLWRTENAIGST